MLGIVECGSCSEEGKGDDAYLLVYRPTGLADNRQVRSNYPREYGKAGGPVAIRCVTAKQGGDLPIFELDDMVLLWRRLHIEADVRVDDLEPCGVVIQ